MVIHKPQLHHHDPIKLREVVRLMLAVILLHYLCVSAPPLATVYGFLRIHAQTLTAMWDVVAVAEVANPIADLDLGFGRFALLVVAVLAVVVLGEFSAGLGFGAGAASALTLDLPGGIHEAAAALPVSDFADPFFPGLLWWCGFLGGSLGFGVCIMRTFALRSLISA